MGFRVLGQAAPAATTDVDLFTAVGDTVISSITVANRAATETTFRVAVRPNAGALANQHYVAYDIPVTGNDMVALTLGITLDAADVVTVRGGSANLTFNAFGQEV